MPTPKTIQYSMKVKFEVWFQTLHDNMQQGVQTDATYNIQQCWELLQHSTGTSCSHTLNIKLGWLTKRVW